jgi:hypothetical protein
MSQTPPVAPDALPTAPNTSVPTGFAATMDAFLAALVTFRTQVAALGTNMYNNCVDAFNSAINAAASATSAAASATAAGAASGVTLWVSGTTYSVGDRRFSPGTPGVYRRRTAGAGTTDPSADATNWELISYGVFPYLHVREEQASGTNGGTSTSSTQHVRILNTTVGTNSIAGASLASNIVTLPAGTYEIRSEAPCLNGSAHKLSLYNDSDSADILVGVSVASASSTGVSVLAICSGRFTLATAKNIKLRHYISTGTATSGLGLAVGSGSVEVYASLQIWKVA